MERPERRIEFGSTTMRDREERRSLTTWKACSPRAREPGAAAVNELLVVGDGPAARAAVVHPVAATLLAAAWVVPQLPEEHELAERIFADIRDAAGKSTGLPKSRKIVDASIGV
jgi:hypothetical protein